MNKYIPNTYERMILESGDYTIVLNVNNGRFDVYAIEDDSDKYVKMVSDKSSLDDCRTYIADRIKRLNTIKKSKIEPLLSFKKGRYGSEEYVETKITSIAEESTYGLYVWNTRLGIRSKDSISNSFLKHTDSNIELLKQIQDKKKELNQLQNTLVFLTNKDVKAHFGEKNDN
jgi:hypothetical protein